jgi:hypothetical protein
MLCPGLLKKRSLLFSVHHKSLMHGVNKNSFNCKYGSFADFGWIKIKEVYFICGMILNFNN